MSEHSDESDEDWAGATPEFKCVMGMKQENLKYGKLFSIFQEDLETYVKK